MYSFNQSINAVNITLGGACNKKCPYCMQMPDINNKKGDVVYFFENFKKFIEDNDIKEINSVHYWGGETLLYFDGIEYLFTNINKLRYAPFHRITTNGTLIDEEYVDFCNRNKEVFTVVSLHDFALSDEQWKVIGKLNRFSVSGLIRHGVVHSEHFRQEWERICDLIGREVGIGLYQTHSTDGCSSDCWLTKEDVNEYFSDLMNNVYPKALAGDRFCKRIIGNFIFDCEKKSREIHPKCFHDKTISVDLFGNLLQCHHNDNVSNRVGNIFNNMHYIPMYVNSDKNFKSEECQKCEALPLCKGGCYLSKCHDVECHFEKIRWHMFRFLEENYVSCFLK